MRNKILVCIFAFLGGLVFGQEVETSTKISKKPLVIIDGIVSDLQKLYLLEEDKIQNINIIERTADLLPTANVGDRGMIVVVTKNGEKAKLKRSKKVTYLVNDKEYNEEEVNKIDPKSIKSIHILKDKVSKEVFGDNDDLKIIIKLKKKYKKI